MLNNYKLDIKVINNLNKIRLRLLFLPFLLLFVIAIFLFLKNAFSVEGYIEIQENLFFYLNGKLAEFPNLQFNLTQLGDALVFFSLLAVFIVYTPKLWGAILTSGLISLVFSASLKKLFSVPRPAAIFDNESFVIVGKTLTGHTSLPSGHSITTLTVITLLLFAFMPKLLKSKIVWSLFVIIIGLIIALSRVGVGAHFPLDVLIGSIIGYISAILGIIINNKVSWWNWIQNKKYYPVFILLLTICFAVITKKVLENNLLVFYFSLLSLVVTLFLMIKIYAKKEY